MLQDHSIIKSWKRIKHQEATALLDSEKVDLVILDLMLPEMSGPELCLDISRPVDTDSGLDDHQSSRRGTELSNVFGADDLSDKTFASSGSGTLGARDVGKRSSLEEAETILLALAQTVEHGEISIPANISSGWREK